MSDPIPVPQGWIAAIAGSAWAALVAVFAYFYHRLDKVEERVGNAISRDELAAIEARIEARAIAAETRVGSMHSDSNDNFREIRLQLESVNNKLFELASKK